MHVRVRVCAAVRAYVRACVSACACACVCVRAPSALHLRVRTETAPQTSTVQRAVAMGSIPEHVGMGGNTRCERHNRYYVPGNHRGKHGQRTTSKSLPLSPPHTQAVQHRQHPCPSLGERTRHDPTLQTGRSCRGRRPCAETARPGTGGRC